MEDQKKARKGNSGTQDGQRTHCAGASGLRADEGEDSTKQVSGRRVFQREKQHKF